LSRFILRCKFLAFDDLYFVDLVVVDLVLCWRRFTVLFVELSSGFDFDFLSTSQEIGWEKCPQNEQFSVEWDVKP